MMTKIKIIIFIMFLHLYFHLFILIYVYLFSLYLFYKSQAPVYKILSQSRKYKKKKVKAVLCGKETEDH